jgi:DNA gyrase subunit A
MVLARPDLSNLDPEVAAYIISLESELERLRPKSKIILHEPEPRPLDPDEAPTPANIITATAGGSAKRTPRHLYSRQHRAGMGVFDLDSPVTDPPLILSSADEDQSVLLFTSQARGFRLQLNRLDASPVRGRGEEITARLELEAGETLAAILPMQTSGYVALLSRSGMIRCLRHHLFGEYMRPGASFYNPREFGPLASVCWTPGDGDLLVATRKGLAIRFAEKSAQQPQGVHAIRLDGDDEAVAVTPVQPESLVFLLGSDGRGALRSMSNFNANKAPGGGGKIALKADRLTTAFTVDPSEDIFIITRLGKIIRYQAAEMPQTDGTVQGVICVSLRGDEAVAAYHTLHGGS